MNRKLLYTALAAGIVGLAPGWVSAASHEGEAMSSEGGAQSSEQMSGQTQRSGAMGAEGGMQAQAQQPDPSQSNLAENLLGKDVKGSDGETVGTLSNLVVDKSGKITFGVLSKGGIAGIGAKSYAVPWDRFSISANNEIDLDVAKDQVDTEFSAFEAKQFGGKTQMQESGEEGEHTTSPMEEGSESESQ